MAIEHKGPGGVSSSYGARDTVAKSVYDNEEGYDDAFVIKGTIPGAGPGGEGYSDEKARDAVGAALVAGTHSGITVDVNDAANSISLALANTSGVTNLVLDSAHSNRVVSYNIDGNSYTCTYQTDGQLSAVFKNGAPYITCSYGSSGSVTFV